MKHKMKDGITIGQSFYLKENKRAGFPYYIRLMQLFVTLAGGWSWISILIECFSIPVSTIYINMAVVITSIVFYLLLLLPDYDIVKTISMSLFCCLVVYIRFPSLQNGFYHMENLVLDRVEDYYGYSTYRFIANYEMQEKDLTLLLIMLIIPIIALLSAAIIRSRYINLCNVVLFIPVAASFAFGLIPSEIYLITYLVVVLYSSRAYLSGHHTRSRELKSMLQRVNSRVALWLCAVSLFLFALTRLFYSPQQYEEVTQIKEVKTKLQNFLYDFSIEDFTEGIVKFPKNSVATGGLDGGKLGGVDRVEFNNTTHLKVIAPISSVSEGLYLKGYVGSEYTGHSWKDHNQETDINYLNLTKNFDNGFFVPLDQSIQLMDFIYEYRNMSDYKFSFSQSKLQIIYEKANPKFVYAPYYTDYSISEQLDYYQDLYVTPVNYNDNSYEYSFYFNISDEEGSPILWNPVIYNGYEKLYRDFVYQTYTRLPEKGLDRLIEHMSAVKKELIGYNEMEIIEYIKDYLHMETRYSLAPGRLPEDKDFVEYFLFDNKLGYCAHYASAATLMLRTIGIPARYVEGYAAGMENVNRKGQSIEGTINIYSNEGREGQATEMVELLVLDSDAHAWVEVYLDDRGWVPIEFTPAAGIENTTAATRNLAITGEEKKEEITPTPTPIPTLTPTPTVAPANPTKSPHQNNSGNNIKSDNNKEEIDSTGGLNEHIKNILWGLAIIILPVASLLGVLVLIKSGRVVRIAKANRSKKALLIYREIEKLLIACRSIPGGKELEDLEEYVKEHCPYLEKDEFDNCMEMIKKARFSNVILNPQEYRKVKNFYFELYQRIYHNVGILKRIYLRLILI